MTAEIVLFTLLLIPVLLGLSFCIGRCFGRGLYREKLKMTHELMALLKENGK